jgi:glyoxylase-like metal-dependent hydrolase (beta-lactamase superfamily II)
VASPQVQHFYHPDSGTLSYVVSDPATSSAAVIDPVLGFDSVSGRTDSSYAQAIIEYLRDCELRLQWILETHAHADHLSAAQAIKENLGGDIAIGAGIVAVRSHFSRIFNLQASDAEPFDRLLADDEALAVGDIPIRVIPTPGHTSDSITYLIGDAAFVGDSLFMPDSGTARCDFPGGEAGTLYDSIQRLFALPPDTRLFICHDYQPNGRALRFATTVAEQMADNIHVGGGRSRKDFIALREKRDATLSLPKLIVPSIQVNIRAGHLPPAENNGIAYLKIPLDRF